MPFGLTNAPATFMRTMNNLFHDLLDRGVVVFLDDILLYSQTADEHASLLRTVLRRLQSHSFFCKLKKCQFFRPRTTFLGHDITQEGLSINPDKIEAVKKWPTPTTRKQVQSYLGFVQFFRKFIKNFSAIALPLTTLTSKDVPFSWTDECEKSFRTLNDAVTTAPILQIFQPSEAEVEVHTDASNYAMGATLM